MNKQLDPATMLTIAFKVQFYKDVDNIDYYYANTDLRKHNNNALNYPIDQHIAYKDEKGWIILLYWNTENQEQLGYGAALKLKDAIIQAKLDLYNNNIALFTQIRQTCK